MFVFFWGRLHYGAIDEFDGAYVATLFSHFQGMPFMPQGTYVVFPRKPGVPLQTVRVASDARSENLGWARAWGLVAVGAVAVGGVIAIFTAGSGLVDVALPTAVPLLALAAYLWLLRGTRAARRGLLRAYFVSTGLPADPARLVDGRDLAKRLCATLERRCEEVAPEDYRQGSKAGRPWSEIALDPKTTDLRLLAEALTLARVEGALAADDRRDPSASEALHDALWKRLRERGPSIVTTRASETSMRAIGGAVFAFLVVLLLSFGHLMHLGRLAAEARRSSEPRSVAPGATAGDVYRPSVAVPV